MEHSELISVIIPVYKVEKYLDRCLTSVVNQSYNNIEIIIIDDGSPDQCPKICNEWAEKDRRIVVIHKENGGVSSARNMGLKVAHGSWISFVDSDDWLHPQFVETLFIQAQRVKADVIVSDFIRTKEMMPYKQIYVSDISLSKVGLSKIFRNNHIRDFVWGKLYRSELLKDKQFDESIHFGEDSLFNVMIFASESVNVYYTSEQLYYYFDRDSSVVNTLSRLRQTELYEKYAELAKQESREWVKEIYLTEGMKRALSSRYSAKLKPDMKDVVLKCNQILNDSLKEYLPLRNVALKNKLVHAVFIKIPQVYRIWRIMDDPTMLNWEKKMRDNRQV